MGSNSGDLVDILPADERREPGSANLKVAKYPAPADIAGDDPAKEAESIIASLNQALAARDYNAVSQLFHDDSYWRDHLALTWEFRTLDNPSKIADLLSKECRLVQVELDTSAAHKAPQVASIDALGTVKGVVFFTTFTTTLGSGQGFVRLAKVGGKWKFYTFFTTLKKLKDVDEPRAAKRPVGHGHGPDKPEKNWKELRDQEQSYEGSEPAVLIIGAGQGGLSLAARLKMQNVDALIVDRQKRVGDNWRNRYRRLVLHDPVWLDHLPYVNFPDHWPIYTPKDKLGDFFEAYVNLLELNVWLETELVSSEWDDAKQQWTVTVERTLGDQKTRRTFHPRHVVQATGHSGKKNFPTIKGMETFEGPLCHSSDFRGAAPNSQGKRAIVVGSCNSGHDIAQDFYDNGYDVMMVQRSSTLVVSTKNISDIFLYPLYSEVGPPVEDADMMFIGTPWPLHKALNVEATRISFEADRPMLEGLTKAGFKLDKGPDGAGLFYKYFQRGGGYYIDVGTSQVIADGGIRMKSGTEPSEITARGIRFADGEDLEADEIVFATGYQNMRTQARAMFGDRLGDKVGDVWGLSEEGEFRTMWQRSGHPGFWFMGGNLVLCRYHSQLLALQIKALEEGIATYDKV
ncbi:flavin-binding monooxygenase-like protein [Microdochium trichocladiopsis]|uniref:Flavin-binding monooxygenase-like protein n=1 Tax=Microdochium trichocladiopsis TaxID=1682393 RepID=A0A9P9BWT7_9PEZI|nr:flavin-binding monooxygenase-like protein [Microdochium trichocladiopsis]KAH7040920.1 flavin-binding monooxygenase-like protein [Microdochium trichocladiopsis]